MTTKNARIFTYEALSYLQRPEVPAAPRFLLLCAAAGDIVAWADVDRIDVHNPTEGCLPKPAKSNGFLWITFQREHSRRQQGSLFSAAFPVGAPRARVPIDVCRPS